jgi:hypothetical protein
MTSLTPRDAYYISHEYDATPADHAISPLMDRGCCFGHDTRFRSSATAVPGPGSYECPSKRSDGTTSFLFTSQVPRELFEREPLPIDSVGPGQRSWSFPRSSAPFGARAKRRSIWRLQRNPSPDAYRVGNRGAVPDMLAPFGFRQPRIVYAANDNPSPADYTLETPRRFCDLSERPFLQRAPRFEKPRQNNEFTCPGQYEADIREVADRARLRSLPHPVFRAAAARETYPVEPAAPGPGFYSPASADSHRLMCCVDSTTRSKPGTYIGQPIIPGPGPAAYSLPGFAPGRAYIRHTDRKLFDEKVRAPAPDRYDVSGSMVKPSLNALFTPDA